MTTNKQYDEKNAKSIIEFAKKLIGKSIAGEYGKELDLLGFSSKDKGQLGKAIEKLYFKYEPNSKAKADFEEAGLELKSSGLKKLKDGGLRAKERLVLSIINYFSIIDENFEDDFLNGKNGYLLLIFYIYQTGLSQLSSEIKYVGDWKYPEQDIEIIRQDWLKIQEKVKNGKAHELSEGDTLYLGACTKGASASSVRTQPNSIIPAKQRAFSLKQGYLNSIINSIANKHNSEKIFKEKTLNFEDAIIEKFSIFYGKNIDELVNILDVKAKRKAKNFYAILSKKILGISENKEIEEFEKAEIIIKTVRLQENNLPKEDISFPNFHFTEIVNQKWEDSNFYEILEKKFLFVFFRIIGDDIILEKVKFWNMPHSDILEAEKVWNITKNIIQSGNIVKQISKQKNGKVIRKTNFPRKSQNYVAHVRPHAQNSSDTEILPIKDILTGINEYTKHCFWLNADYVKNEIFLK